MSEITRTMRKRLQRKKKEPDYDPTYTASDIAKLTKILTKKLK